MLKNKNFIDHKVKISNKIIKQLGMLIAGDLPPAQYMSGPELVEFYNEFGNDDIYGAGFPTRWRYSADKISQINGTPVLKKVLEDFVDPRRYGGDEELVSQIVSVINGLIKYDDFELVRKGNNYEVVNVHGNFIEPDVISTIDHEFVSEQTEKCQQKIAINDFSGAITNARTLCETVLIYIIETIEVGDVKNDGDIINLWGKAKKALKIDLNKGDIPDPVFQILSGLNTSLNGLAALSNSAGDRHARKFKTKRHHAKLAVNIAMTLCDFLIAVLNQRTKKDS